MKAVAIAAAGAAVIGSVHASSHVKNMHARIHANVARDNWYDWNSTTTTTPIVDPQTTSSTTESQTWADWTSTTSDACGPTTTSTVSCSGGPGVGKPGCSTSTLTVYPEGCTTVDDVGTTSSSSSSSTSSDYTWADWTSTTSDACGPTTTSTVSCSGGPGVGKPGCSTSTITVYPEGCTTVDDASTTPTFEHTWGDWTGETATTVDEVASASTDPAHTWGDWTSEESTTTVTLKSTITETKYVDPVTSTADVTSAIASSTISDWSDWASPSLTVDAGECVVSVITSYGAPTWYPTPVVDPVTSSETWGDWDSSSTPVVDPVTSSSTEHTWADWTSSTSPVVDPATTTDATTWADWTSSTSPVVDPATTTDATTWADWTSTASAPESTSTDHGSWPARSDSSAPITANGDKWALTYSPYTADGQCKDAWTVSKDLTIIAAKGFTSVRVYSTDCDTLASFGAAARATGLKLILGVWISSSGIEAAKAQVDHIVEWAQWDLVELIVVGNEAVFNKWCSASDLAAFVKSSGDAFKAAGYTGLVTTTEPLSVWEEPATAAAFCSVVDVVGANLYAFFNAEVTADKAGEFIQAQINILNGICGDVEKPVYVLESGWPHAGNCNGAACPSPENQATALQGIKAAVGAKVTFLSYEDEPWKEPGQFGVEQYWGCGNVF